jgi:glucose/arabinose dehydrogenase
MAHGSRSSLQWNAGAVGRRQRKRSSARAYGIPSDNPFANDPKAEPEIFAYGLRNPWKYSFDDRGRLIAGDVGQEKWEEVSIVPSGGNMGWRVFEGVQCYDAADTCDALRGRVVTPIAIYDHTLGASITGGFQYQGKQIPGLARRYVFGDFITGRIWSMNLPEKNLSEPLSGSALMLHGKWDILISSFARDHDGELYVADFSRGAIFRIVPQS